MEAQRSRREAYARLTADGLTLLVAAPTARRSNDVDYEYRPNSDFYYLTGFPEPEAALLLIPAPEIRTILFVRPRNPEHETWDGPRAGLDGARDLYGADEVFPIDELESVVQRHLEACDRLYFGFGTDPAIDARIVDWLNQARGRRRGGSNALHTVSDAASVLHELRLRKDAHDLAALRQAAEISARAHRAAMQAARPGLWEYELEALVEYHFAAAGATFGYPSIVGSGRNATILHYIENRRRIEPGDLILIDAAAEVDCLTADLTRTFPANGRFTRAQRELYEIVLEAEIAAIDAARAGASFDAPHTVALRILVGGLLRLGLLHGDLEEHLVGTAYRRFFMHRTSHWLGMDVHDVGSYKQEGAWRPLEPGMVLTVEPGLYIPLDDETVPEQYRGLGVRIEDDLLVTASEPEVLTAAAPKLPEEIESLMSATSVG